MSCNSVVYQTSYLNAVGSAQKLLLVVFVAQAMFASLRIICTSSSSPVTHDDHPAPRSDCNPPPLAAPLADHSCSRADLQALHSIAAVLPKPAMASWRRQATSINCCCGSWPRLNITCTGTPPPPPPPTTTTAAGDVPHASLVAGGRVTRFEIAPTTFNDDRSYMGALHWSAGIPASVCRLSALTSLRLVALSLSGPIPDCIATNLTALVELDLSFNDLTGSIPPSLFLAHHLQVLHLSVNSLSGPLPPLSPTSRITSLSLNANALSGPFPASLASRLPHLSHLDLFSNLLSGPLPSALTLPNLTFLDLGHNAFSGPLPSFRTPKLSTLRLDHNSISGSLHPLFHASNLSALASLELTANFLDGDLDAPDLAFRRSPGGLAADKPLWGMFLAYNQFGGSLPASFLCGATEILEIASNQFSGNLPDLQHCANYTVLRWLDISNNRLTGALPDWLGAFPNLASLSVAHNSLIRGSIIPGSWKSLKSLVHLEISGTRLLKPTNLTHAAPKLPCWLFSLPHLTSLHLSSTGLQDSDIQDLDLGKSCAIAPGGNRSLLQQLDTLDLSQNNFTASLFLHTSSLASIGTRAWLGRDLNLSGNPLRLDLSDPTMVKLIPIPVRTLDLSSCKLRGSLSGLFVSRLTAASPLFLYLAHNYLHGRIPSEFGNMSQLIQLDLSYNHLSGLDRLSHNGFLSRLSMLDLSNNNLVGDLSTLISDIAPNMSSSYYAGGTSSSSLQNLDLSHNFITGVIPPSLFQCLLSATSPIYRLELSYNRLTGALSDVAPFLPKSIQVLSVSHNQLSGQIPPSFRNLTQLQLLNLGYNKLHGNLHHFFSPASSSKRYPRLRVLLLSNNLFMGNIPTALGDVAPALQLIDVSRNHLTGSIPVQTLVSIQALRFTNSRATTQTTENLRSCVTHNLTQDFSAEVLGLNSPDILDADVNIIVKGNDEKFSHISRALTSLDFSHNRLSGSISRGLGELSGLVYLNLSNNNLSGPIPSDLGCLGGQLQALDLSFNMLEGSIPLTLGNLTMLEVFNVSYNPQLTGPIIENHPQMQNRDSYIGDPNLCGAPVLPNACTPPSALGAPRSAKGPSTSHSWVGRLLNEWVSIPGLCLGIFGGFLVCVLILNACGWYQ